MRSFPSCPTALVPRKVDRTGLNRLPLTRVTGTRAETKDILSSLRTQNGLDEQAKQRALQGELVGLLKGRKVAA